MSGECRRIHVSHIPALSDNYMYVFKAQHSQNCCAVDPVEPLKLKAFLDFQKLILTDVFVTHHHWDHAGGNKQLSSMYPGISFHGGDDRIDCLTNFVQPYQQVKVGSLDVTCLFTPCHTKGHMCYYIREGGNTPVLFSGDTLFVGGCGRFFEGSPAMMYKALIVVLGGLPNETLVYCGHEYTVKNLEFARQVDPSNANVAIKLSWAKNKRKHNEATVPSTIGDEKQTNPFMRVEDGGLQSSCGQSDPVEVMKVLRAMKDDF